MRRATGYEHLDHVGEAGSMPGLAARQQCLVDSVRMLELRYARLNRSITDLGERYRAVGVVEDER